MFCSGLDIPQVGSVININVPASYHDYIHRIGRAGRAGNQYMNIDQLQL